MVVTVLRREDVLVLSKSSVASHKAFLLKVVMSLFTSPDVSACLFYSLFRSSRFVFRVPACTSTCVTLAHSLLCEPTWVPAWEGTLWEVLAFRTAVSVSVLLLLEEFLLLISRLRHFG